MVCSHTQFAETFILLYTSMHESIERLQCFCYINERLFYCCLKRKKNCCRLPCQQFLCIHFFQVQFYLFSLYFPCHNFFFISKCFYRFKRLFYFLVHHFIFSIKMILTRIANILLLLQIFFHTNQLSYNLFTPSYRSFSKLKIF